MDWGGGKRRNGEKDGSKFAVQSSELKPIAYTPPHLADRIRAEQAALEARGATDSERKTITALFADLKGSTALIEGLDPEEARAIIDPALQLMMDAVHQYDGYVAQTLGDGIFALFGAPLAHEDHPQRALYTALRMQEEMRRYADTLRHKGYLPLLMRVGVNTGEVVVRSIRKDDLHADYVPVGYSTNLAARMEQLAAPGSILATAYTQRLTDGYFAFKDLGPTQIKEVEEPLNIYEVLSVGPLRTRLQVAARRGLTRFVGRQSEMEQLQRALEVLYTATLSEHYSDLAHHYRRSTNAEKAIEYLQLAGQQAVQHSANPEAITHLTAALELLLTRPETPERAAQELTLRLAVGPPLMTAQGWAAPAVEQNYTRARALCDQLGDIPQRVPVLYGLWSFHLVRGELRTVQALAEECLQLAEQTHEEGLLVEAHYIAGASFLCRGEFVRAQAALEQSVAHYQPQHHTLTPLYGGINPGVMSLYWTAWALWSLGHPEQALTRLHKALHLAQELGHPYSLVNALSYAARLHVERGDGHLAQESADAMVALSSEHGFPWYLAWGTIHRGAALIAQAQWAEGVAQIRQGLETFAGEISRTLLLAWLAAGYGRAGQAEDGLAATAEALRLVDKNDERWYEAELYRLRGELTLAQSSVQRLESSVTAPRSLLPDPQAEAQAYFLKAIDIAQKQQAKSWELRATMSLARLWQQQGKHAEARQILADIYGWFTEGFDTKDLQEAKALLGELG